LRKPKKIREEKKGQEVEPIPYHPYIQEKLHYSCHAFAENNLSSAVTMFTCLTHVLR
jgi:hypothetical protein